MKIAVVEDEKTSQTYIKKILISQGYEVDVFENGRSFLDSYRKKKYRVVILDINLPDMTGFDVCSIIKKNSENYGNSKILILSNRKDQIDINKGLKVGADDYIKKPFDDTEFILRLNNIIEKHSDLKIDRINYKGTLIDFCQSYIVEDNIKIELTNKEKEILHYLIVNLDLVMRKEKIYYEVWNDEFFPGNKNVEVYIGKLKKKANVLRENLVTFKNLGYKLIG